MTREELLTDRLNDTGFPFQDLCVDLAARQPGWQVAAEVAYTYPPSNTAALGQSGSIDVLTLLADIPAVIDRSRLSVWLVGECKRATPSIKTWVFIRDPRERSASFVIAERTPTGTYLPKTVTTLALGGLGYGAAHNYAQAHQAFECNALLTTINRTQDDKVYRAMRQANHGLTALVNNCVALDGRIALSEKGALFIPVVVTTADLVVASYPLTSVDVTTGIVPPEAVTYQPAQWIPFAFPLPDFMAVSGSHSRTTFIVAASHWPFFLNRVGDFTV